MCIFFFKELFKNSKQLVNDSEIIKNLYDIYGTIQKVPINLNDLAKEIKDNDSGEKNISLINSKEILGILGKRWREMPADQFLSEIITIYERAGLKK